MDKFSTLMQVLGKQPKTGMTKELMEMVPGAEFIGNRLGNKLVITSKEAQFIDPRIRNSPKEDAIEPSLDPLDVIPLFGTTLGGIGADALKGVLGPSSESSETKQPDEYEARLEALRQMKAKRQLDQSKEMLVNASTRF